MPAPHLTDGKMLGMRTEELLRRYAVTRSQKLKLQAESPDLRNVVTAILPLFGDERLGGRLLVEDKSVSVTLQIAPSDGSPVICDHYRRAILLPWWRHHVLHDSPNEPGKPREISCHIGEAQR